MRAAWSVSRVANNTSDISTMFCLDLPFRKGRIKVTDHYVEKTIPSSEISKFRLGDAPQI